MGFRYGPEWVDMSEFIVHFTKQSKAQYEDPASDEQGNAPDGGSLLSVLGPLLKRREGASDYYSMMSILSSGQVRLGNTFGCARGVAPVSESQRAVCFSEIPPHLLSRLVRRRKTKYGIGFTKAFATRNGAMPIWYVPKGSSAHKSIQRIQRAAKLDEEHPIWSLTPFIDVPGRYRGGNPYDFEWEREWRATTPFRFKPKDVAFLLIPEALHDAAYGFFQDAVAENTGPGYFCPYLDPTWSIERVQQALKAR